MNGSLHFNMCNLPSSYVFDSEVPGLNISINKTFSICVKALGEASTPAKNEADDLLYGLKDFLGISRRDQSFPGVDPSLRTRMKVMRGPALERSFLDGRCR
jgi:hypothetical protein